MHFLTSIFNFVDLTFKFFWTWQPCQIKVKGQNTQIALDFHLMGQGIYFEWRNFDFFVWDKLKQAESWETKFWKLTIWYEVLLRGPFEQQYLIEHTPPYLFKFQKYLFPLKQFSKLVLNCFEVCPQLFRS